MSIELVKQFPQIAALRCIIPHYADAAIAGGDTVSLIVLDQCARDISGDVMEWLKGKAGVVNG